MRPAQFGALCSIIEQRKVNMKPSTMKKKADEHWDYIETVLLDEIPEDQSYSKREYIEGVGRHYRAALVHGIKHGQQEVNNDVRYKS